MRESDQLETLAQEIWDADQVLFARGSLPRDWLLANEFVECTEARMWESSGFFECANNILLVASDGLGGSRDTPKTLRQVAFGMATFTMQIISDTSFKLQRIGFLGGQADRRFHVPSFGPTKSSTESTKRRTSKFR